MTTPCGTCDAALPDGGVACFDCIDLLIQDLRLLGGWTSVEGRAGHTEGRQIHGLLHDLEITGCRMDNVPLTGDNWDDNAVRTLDHKYPLTASQSPSAARLDALLMKRRIDDCIGKYAGMLGVPWGIAVIPWLIDQRLVLRMQDWISDMIHTLSGDNGLVVRAKRLVDRPDGAVRILCPMCSVNRVVVIPDEMTYCRCGEGGVAQWWIAQSGINPDGEDKPLPLRDLCGLLLVRYGLDVSLKALTHMQQRGQIVKANVHKPECDTIGLCDGCIYPTVYEPEAVAHVLLGRKEVPTQRRSMGNIAHSCSTPMPNQA